MFEVIGLDHIALEVKDLDKSMEWYQRVLGLKQFRDEAWGPIPLFLVSHSIYFRDPDNYCIGITTYDV